MTNKTDLVLVQSVPATIEFNLEEYREGIRQELKEYDVVVTVDTLKGAKDLSADLNKKAKELGDKFKEVNKVVTAPITAVGVKVKEIVAEILESRTKLVSQIAKFEDERKETAREVLTEERNALWLSLGVSDEFKRCKVDSLALLGSLTPKDKLTTAAMRDLSAMVQQDKALQTQTENRVLTLENECYKAGLKSPLTRNHVEGFLFIDDHSYKSNLERLIESELTRQKQIEESIEREQAEKAHKAAHEPVVQEVAIEPVIEHTVQQEVIEPQPQPQPEVNQDLEHRKACNIEAMEALMALGLDKKIAQNVVKAAVTGKIGKIRMYY